MFGNTTRAISLGSTVGSSYLISIAPTLGSDASVTGTDRHRREEPDTARELEIDTEERACDLVYLSTSRNPAWRR